MFFLHRSRGFAEGCLYLRRDLPGKKEPGGVRGLAPQRTQRTRVAPLFRRWLDKLGQVRQDEESGFGNGAPNAGKLSLQGLLEY